MEGSGEEQKNVKSLYKLVAWKDDGVKVIRNSLPIKLQPLRIPSGWEISYNTLLELDPGELEFEDKEGWVNFTEDLLQLKYIHNNIILDAGWYPEADPNGKYGLELIKNYDWNDPLFSLIQMIRLS